MAEKKCGTEAKFTDSDEQFICDRKPHLIPVHRDDKGNAVVKVGSTFLTNSKSFKR